jgi:class 3 adenylate cyclase/quercetin dioxygenase-like cupin family protein
MPEAISKNLEQPDEVIEFPGFTEHVVELGDVTVGRAVHEPGWRWSTHVKPRVGGEWCQARHIGYVVSGRMAVVFPDGNSFELEPGDVFDIPPGHDGFVIGDEPCVELEWAGIRAFAGYLTGVRSRVLATLLFTDLVGSTELVRQLGDLRWRELLSRHFEAVRAELERYGGREIHTTGDGMLAIFDGSARALHCALAIRQAANADGLRIRAGIHVGEVELVGGNVRGVAVHEAARIMAAAGEDEILVSDLTRTLAGPSGFAFEDRGAHELKGLEGEWRLSALSPELERSSV